MRASMECTDARELLYDQRHDRLDDMDLVLLEAHLQECAKCRDHRMRLVGMLDSAAHHDPLKDVAFDRDALFERISGQLQAPELTPAPVKPEIVKKTVEIHEEYRRRPRYGAIAAVLVACLLAVLLVPRMLDDGTTDVPVSDHGPAMVELILDDDDSTPTSPAARPGQAFEGLTEQAIDSTVLSVFASGEAHWRLEGTRDLRLSVEKGVLLVEYVPDGQTSLTVSSPTFEARVTGTVFYVIADEARLGVLSGQVEVAGRTDASILRVGAGQEVDRTQNLAPISPAVTEAATKHVDLATHEDKLSSRPVEATEPIRRPPAKPDSAARTTSKPSPAPPSAEGNNIQ
jgi:hypothetical protein